VFDNAIISGITSDIGIAIARDWLTQGVKVHGTYRTESNLPSDIRARVSSLTLCDFENVTSVDECLLELSYRDWDVFVGLAATPGPLVCFGQEKWVDWLSAFEANFLNQLRLLRGLIQRVDDRPRSVVFLAGPGTNSPPIEMSSLILAKLGLIKFCEILSVERPEISAFTLGPGWVKTKTHKEVLAREDLSERKRQQLVDFVKSDNGASVNEVVEGLNLILKHAGVARGRNFSLAGDLLHTEGLYDYILGEPDALKLRRHSNDWRPTID